MSVRCYSDQLLFFAPYYQSTPLCLKVRGGWWVGWVAHVIFVSAQGPNPSFFLFIQLLFDLGACWDQDLDQGLTIIIVVVMLIICIDFLSSISSQGAKFTGDRHTENNFWGIPCQF